MTDEERQRREDAVAGRRVVGEQQVAGLLAAEVGAQPLHLLVHVAVADLRLDDADAGRLAEHSSSPRLAMTVVTTVLALSRPRVGHVPRGDGQHVVAVADLAGVVDRDQPIAVAVEGEADVGAARRSRACGAPRDAARRSRR